MFPYMFQETEKTILDGLGDNRQEQLKEEFSGWEQSRPCVVAACEDQKGKHFQTTNALSASLDGSWIKLSSVGADSLPLALYPGC